MPSLHSVKEQFIAKWKDTDLRRQNTAYRNPQLDAQHYFVASFRRCFPFFTLRDQKHLLWVEKSCCEK